jgi:hypothetical protein
MSMRGEVLGLVERRSWWSVDEKLAGRWPRWSRALWSDTACAPDGDACDCRMSSPHLCRMESPSREGGSAMFRGTCPRKMASPEKPRLLPQ